MNLRTIQQQFKHALLTGEYAALLAEIYGSDQADKQNRLNIYRDNVRGSCLKVLEQAYPVCGRVLGEHIFLRAARGYVLTHPSRSSDLNTYGAAFTDFLSLLCQQETDLHPYPFLPDLAHLEWAFHCAYDGARDSAFDYQALQAVSAKDYADIVFILSSVLRLIASRYRIAAVWSSGGRTAGPSEVQTEYLCVHRRQMRPAMTVIDEEQYRLLTAIQSQTPFAVLTEQFSGIDGMLSALVKRGWVCGFQTVPRHAG